MDYFNTSYCPHCNSELEPDARFCIVCGTAISEAAPEPVFGSSAAKFCSCGAENDADSAFCIICGRALEGQNDLFYENSYGDYGDNMGQKICSCGTVNEPDSVFCVGCGQPLGSADISGYGSADGKVCSCGTVNEPDSVFCVGCGQPLGSADISGYDSADGKVCSCGTVNEPDSVFCVGCGQPLDKRNEDTGGDYEICSKCGAKIEPGDQFCTVCAAPVDDSMVLSRCPECNGIINPSTGKCGICGYLKKIPASSIAVPPDDSYGKKPVKSGGLVINVEHKPEREYTREMEKAKDNFKVSTDFDV